jgi:hypothetical protein
MSTSQEQSQATTTSSDTSNSISDTSNVPVDTTASLPPPASPSASDTTAAATAATTTTTTASSDNINNNSNSNTSPRQSFLEAQEEGVLNDVLVELDRERSTRAELESRVRELEQNLHSEKRKNATTNSASPRDYMALKTETEGYLELLDALTKDRPAFYTKQKLPVHVVRLLEIIPWDPRARPHLFGQEQVYEWQMYRPDNNWQKELRYFPVFFKTLRIVNPTPGRTVGEAPTSSSPPKQCVLTNRDITQILNIDKGYPLPQDGGDWQWIGGWRIEKTGDSDEKGWSYSNSPEIASDSSTFYSELRMPEKGTKNIIKRRRKWTRSRVMIDYPQASEMTKQYLKLVAEKAGLDVSVEKLSNQLVDTKMNLTTLEAEHLSLQEELAIQRSKMETEIAEKSKILEILEEGMEGAGESALAAAQSSTTTNKDQAKELPSVAGGNVSRQIMFDSLRGKGRHLFENIKLKGGDEIERIKKADLAGRIKQTGVKLPWQLKEEKEEKEEEAKNALLSATTDEEQILDA